MTGNELKPCPHCNGEARSVTDCYVSKHPRSIVVCTNLKCEAIIEKSVDHEYLGISREEAANIAKQAAIDAWNERYSSWDLLMEILDKHYPADIFSDPESRWSKDIGAQIVTKIREINELRNNPKRRAE